MKTTIRHIEEKDRAQVISMMRKFYSSPAVYTDGSDDIFNRDIDNCIGNSDYIEGYVFVHSGEIQGYAMIAKSFSTEFGKACIWIEDLYIKEEFRGMGTGGLFLRYIEDKYPDSVYRLEVEEENEKAVKLYKNHGYSFLPYMEMKK